MQTKAKSGTQVYKESCIECDTCMQATISAMNKLHMFSVH